MDLEWNISTQNEINENTIRRKNVEGDSENSIDIACIEKIPKNKKQKLLNGFKDEIKKQLARHIRKKASMDLQPQVLEPTRTGYRETKQYLEEDIKLNVQRYWSGNTKREVTDCLILKAPYNKEDTIAQIFERQRIEHFRGGYDISEILGIGLGLGLPHAVRVQCSVQPNNKVAILGVVDGIEKGHSVFGDMKYIPEGVAIIESVETNNVITLNKNAKKTGNIPITIKKPMYINNFFERTEYHDLPDELFVRISPEEAHAGRNMGRNTDKFNLIDPTFNNKQYYLHAFVVHGGNSLNGGHYRAFVKRRHSTDKGKDQWWHCNDNIIQKADDTELQSYLKTRVYKTNIVYVCYYHTTKQSLITETPVGRANNSNWCWMNAGMQCLLTVPSIRGAHAAKKEPKVYSVQQTLDTREKMITIKTTCVMDRTKVLNDVGASVNRMRVGQSIKPIVGKIEQGTEIVSIGDKTLTLNKATKFEGIVDIEIESIYGQSGKKFKNDVVPKFATTTSRKRKRPQSTMPRSNQQDPMEWLIRPVLESRSVSIATTKKRFFAPPEWWDDTSWSGPDFLAACSLDNTDTMREKWKKRLERILFEDEENDLKKMDIEHDIEKNTPNDDCYNTIIKNNEDISLLIALCA